MSDGTGRARPDFYTIGGALKPAEPSYVQRSADTELLEAVLSGKYCYVLTPRQMGKSSLMVRCANSLREQGTRSAIIDLTSVGTSDTSAEAWYLGQIKRIADQLALGIDYMDWWRTRRSFSVVQRFTDFLGGVVVALTAPKRVVVFVDEIDTTLSLPGYGDDYFAAIRSLYNRRASDPRLERLSFVLLGVASPSDLIPDAQRTPFNIGTRVQLTDFSLLEAGLLQRGLSSDTTVAKELLGQVFVWTSGHPYLTQKVCASIARCASAGSIPAEIPGFVGKLVWDLFLSDAGRNTDGNLQFVRQWVLGTDAAPSVLDLYTNIRGGAAIVDSELDPLRIRLKLSGLIKAAENSRLRVRNAIYEQVFDDEWVGNALAELRRRKARTQALPAEPVTRARASSDNAAAAPQLIMEAVAALEEAGRLDQAIILLGHAQEQYPHDLSITKKLGDVLDRQDRHTEAAEAYTRVAESYSCDGPLLPAIALWQKIRRLDPSALHPCLRLGELYGRQGLVRDALSQYRIVAEESLRRGSTTEAADAFERIVQLDPSDLESRNHLAILLGRANEPQKAIEQYLAVAAALEQSGRVEHALEVIAKGLELDAAHSRLRDERARLQRIQPKQGTDKTGM